MVNNGDTYGTQIPLIGMTYVLTVLIIHLQCPTMVPKNQMQTSLSAK